MHDGTGTLTAYRALIDELATDGRLVGLVPPAGAPAPDAPDLIEELAVGYAREVRAAGHEEVEIVGHGLGGPIALELARALSEADVTVRRLTVVSGRRLPYLPQDDLPFDHAALAGSDPALGDPGRAATLHALFARMVEAAQRYEPELYAGDLTLVRPASHTPLLPGPQDDAAAFWSGVCLGDVTVIDVPGDHGLADTSAAREADLR